MKALWIFPLAYLADVHGFLLFAPYIMAFWTVAKLIPRFKLTADPMPALAMA